MFVQKKHFRDSGSMCCDISNSNAFLFAWFNAASQLQVLLPRIANFVVFSGCVGVLIVWVS